MSKPYYSILTNIGENLVAKATALGTKLDLTTMAVGDGNGKLPAPDPAQTKLINEKRRAAVNSLEIDKNNPNIIIVEHIIPETEGGWYVREIGLFDSEGNLIAVGNCPETYKPKMIEGSGRTQIIRMMIVVKSTECIELKSDPSVVLATREYVDTASKKNGSGTVGNFQKGLEGINELTSKEQLIFDDSTGITYRWDGPYPKNVPANSTPITTGGIGDGAWLIASISEIFAIAVSNNIPYSTIEYLTVGKVSGKSIFYDPNKQQLYFSLNAITGNITDITENENGSVSITVDNKKIDIYSFGVTSGNVVFAKPKSNPTTHGLFKSIESNTGTRIHFEPNGNVDSGTTVKSDYMFDDYDLDKVNYRISSVFNYVGDPNNIGEGAVSVINTKSAGHAWGNFPVLHFGFQDDSQCPMKITMYDSGAEQHYAPMMGPWRKGKQLKSGDYITANNKIYKAISAGVAGSTPPNHTSGVVSDGSIDFEFIRAPKGNDISTTVLIGNVKSMPMFKLPGYSMQIQEPVAIGRKGRLDFYGETTDSHHGRIQAITGANGEKIIDIISPDGIGRLRFDSTNKIIQYVNMSDISTAKNQDGMPEVNISATRLVRVNNKTATNITKFTGGVAGQEFTFESQSDGFTTVKHSEFIQLKSQRDEVMRAKHAIRFLIDATGTCAIQL
ncbi:phage tail protein [Providencia stuartii]|uniref:phage tail-collar fiber domain-containing protein n=1 Tax=Providencia stuartii TaxID=588 RepID=UPI001121FBD1|nr:phage tail protein [Providencia stuartii]